MTSSRKRAKLTGKGGTAQFVLLPHYVLNSNAYLSLSVTQRALLIDVAFLYNGYNNGDLAALAPGIMGKRGWKSRDTLIRAVRVLVERGLLELTRQGGRHAPNLYALTWQPIDTCKGKLEVQATKSASNKWKDYGKVSILPCPPDGQPLSVRRTTDPLKVVNS